HEDLQSHAALSLRRARTGVDGGRRLRRRVVFSDTANSRDWRADGTRSSAVSNCPANRQKGNATRLNRGSSGTAGGVCVHAHYVEHALSGECARSTGLRVCGCGADCSCASSQLYPGAASYPHRSGEGASEVRCASQFTLQRPHADAVFFCVLMASDEIWERIRCKTKSKVIYICECRCLFPVD